MLLGEQRSGSAGRAEVETAVALAGVGDLFRAVALGQHDHRAAVGLEKIDVAVHSSGGGRAEGAGWHAWRGFGRAGVVNRVFPEIFREFAGFFEDFLELRVGDVAGDDDGSGQRECGGDGVFREGFEGFLHSEVEIDRHPLEFPVAEFLGDETAGILLQLFEKNPVLGDFRLGLAIRRAGNADADGARSAVTRQADDADVEREVLAAKLGADPDFAGHGEQFVFQLDVA